MAPYDSVECLKCVFGVIPSKQAQRLLQELVGASDAVRDLYRENRSGTFTEKNRSGMYTGRIDQGRIQGDSLVRDVYREIA